AAVWLLLECWAQSQSTVIDLPTVSPPSEPVLRSIFISFASAPSPTLALVGLFALGFMTPSIHQSVPVGNTSRVVNPYLTLMTARSGVRTTFPTFLLANRFTALSA